MRKQKPLKGFCFRIIKHNISSFNTNQSFWSIYSSLYTCGTFLRYGILLYLNVGIASVFKIIFMGYPSNSLWNKTKKKQMINYVKLCRKCCLEKNIYVLVFCQKVWILFHISMFEPRKNKLNKVRLKILSSNLFQNIRLRNVNGRDVCFLLLECFLVYFFSTISFLNYPLLVNEKN